MKVTVEFFGLARRLAGVKEVSLETADGSNLRDILSHLREKFSSLSPSVIAADVPELVPPYMLSIDGRTVPQDLGFQPREGDRILVLSSMVGG